MSAIRTKPPVSSAALLAEPHFLSLFFSFSVDSLNAFTLSLTLSHSLSLSTLSLILTLTLTLTLTLALWLSRSLSRSLSFFGEHVRFHHKEACEVACRVGRRVRGSEENKKVETSHSAKDASTGMRQAESRLEVSRSFRLFKTCEALAWSPVQDKLKTGKLLKHVARLHQKSESELSRIHDGWHRGRILARFQSSVACCATTFFALCSGSIHVSLSTDASRSTCCYR